MIDFAACEPHFADHLAPIWHALEPHERGTFYATGDGMRAHLASLGILGSDDEPELETSRPIVVAAWGDLKRFTPGQRGRPVGRRAARSSGMSVNRRARPVVFLEHGAGQTYVGVDSPSYSGGKRRTAVRLYLAPGEHVAERNRWRYPRTPTVVVGAPHLDRWHGGLERARAPRTSPPTVAVSFHWDALTKGQTDPRRSYLCPEGVSAFAHYRDALRDLAALPVHERGFQLLGHAHPRRWDELSRWWRSIGVEPVRDFAEVLDRADLYAVDNSSTAPEFASTGRPIVFLNAPWYRRDVHHGGRFWEWPAGQVSVNLPEGLRPGLELGLQDPAPIREARQAMVDAIYCATDGRAAERAAEALREWATHRVAGAGVLYDAPRAPDR